MSEREARRQAEFGSQILDVANPFRNNSQQAAQQSLVSLAPESKLMDPQNRARLYYRLGDLRGRQGWWKESATYFAEGLELEPDPLFFEAYHYYLPVLIQSGDVTGYRRMRQELIRRFGSTTDPRIAECVVKDCLITPWPDANFEDLERLANTALHAEDHWARDYFQFAKALLEFRRANYTSAVWHTRHTYPTTDHYLFVSASMVRAMAQHQLGETEEARNILSYGLEFAQARFPREARLAFDRNWSDWITAHALMDEASLLIDRRLMSEIPKSLATSGHPITAVDTLYFLALEKLRAGDAAGYRQACSVLALVPDCSGHTVAEFRRTWTWCLGPHPIKDLRMPLKHAKQLVANNSLDAHYAENLVLGGMLYRLGQHGKAAQHLEASIAAYPSHPPFTFATTIYPRLLLSMVKSQLGEFDEARRLLAEIEPAVKVELDSRSTMWEFRTTVEILRREAEDRIAQREANEAAENEGRTSDAGKERLSTDN
jgi:tetratricopeptide (TPR) repeat protein